jgi:hypothetical protein
MLQADGEGCDGVGSVGTRAASADFMYVAPPSGMLIGMPQEEIWDLLRWQAGQIQVYLKSTSLLWHVSSTNNCGIDGHSGGWFVAPWIPPTDR